MTEKKEQRPFSQVASGPADSFSSDSSRRHSDSRFFFSDTRLSQLFNVDEIWTQDGIERDRDPPPEPAPRASYCPPSPDTGHANTFPRMSADAATLFGSDLAKFSSDFDLARLSACSGSSRFSSDEETVPFRKFVASEDLTPTPGSPLSVKPLRYSRLTQLTDARSSLCSIGTSSLPSVLSELAGDAADVELSGEDDEVTWSSENVDWQERCLELELALQKFREQAGKIRELLREKLADLEQRVVEAEGRAEDAEEKVRIMEQRMEWTASSNGTGGLVGGTVGDCGGRGSGEEESGFGDEFGEKETVISTLASQVEEQLEEQNAVLREQNAKCNLQLELLRGRLAQLSVMHTERDQEMERKWNRRSLSLPKDSVHASFEGDKSVVNESAPDVTRSPYYHLARPSTLDRGQRRSKSRSPATARRASSSDTDAHYDGLRNYRRRGGGVVQTGALDKRRTRDSGSVDLETPQSLSPKSPLEAMLNSLTQSTGSLPHCGFRSNHRKPVPQPRTKHLRAIGNSTPFVMKSADSIDLDTESTDSSHLTHSGESQLSEDGKMRVELGDYRDMYTPGSVGSANWEDQTNGEKPPTPPLHRFPSWESRIYQVAQEGLSGSGRSNSVDGGWLKNSGLGTYPEIHVPVYAAVKGRASQIRSVPFTGESSDSSDGEEHGGGMDSRGLSSHTPSSSAESSSSSPSKSKTSSLSPAKLSASSPSKSMKRDSESLSLSSGDYAVPPDAMSDSCNSDMSFESGLSDDYAIPPDARSDCVSIDGSIAPTVSAKTSCVDLTNLTTRTLSKTQLCPLSPRHEGTLEKSGYLTKLGGKLKTWKKRYFVLKEGTLSYWKSMNDVTRKPAGQITLDEECRVTRSEGAHTFEVNTGKKVYYLTADNIALVEDWVRVLQNVLKRNATRLLLSREDNKPTLQGWLTKTPLGQINMRDARVDEVEKLSDSEEEDANKDKSSQEDLTIGIFPSHQGPTYLLMPSKHDKDTWMYHLTVVSGGGPNAGTQYEQLVQKLMELDGDSNCVLWRHPLLLYSKEPITSPLSSLPSCELQAEALKLFKSCHLYTSVLMDSSGIDYHIVLCQNALQQCLSYPELQAELFCGLIKQTSKHVLTKPGVQVTKTLNKIKHSRNLFLCATQSLFLCDSSGAQKASSPLSNGQPPPADPKVNPPSYTFIQGWQFLALAVSLFVPKNNKLLWYLKLHLQRNADPKTEIGKYAAYCQRALDRTIQNGGREAKPSRMEVLSIILKNPYHHSVPHAIPVHFLNGMYQVIGFDGSSTVEEFLSSLHQEIGCRDSSQSGFALFSDDPIEKDLEHCLNANAKLCDVISKWETALREKGSGKFENTKVIRLLYKSRFYWKPATKHETDKEKLLLCYQVNQQIQEGKFPLTRDLALELATLMAQIDNGEVNSERSRGSGSSGPSLAHVQQAFNKFYPPRYRQNLSEEEMKNLHESLQEKWISLRGRSQNDCVRIYLTCTRKWPYFGATLFPATYPAPDSMVVTHVWVAVSEDSITLLDTVTMQLLARYGYGSVVTFGGCQEDFMLVVHTSGDEVSHHLPGTHKLLLSMSKPKILELTLLIAGYMNALGRIIPGTPKAGSLTRRGSHRSRSQKISIPGQPDLVKMTSEVDSKFQRSEAARKWGHVGSSAV